MATIKTMTLLQMASEWDSSEDEIDAAPARPIVVETKLEKLKIEEKSEITDPPVINDAEIDAAALEMWQSEQPLQPTEKRSPPTVEKPVRSERTTENRELQKGNGQNPFRQRQQQDRENSGDGGTENGEQPKGNGHNSFQKRQQQHGENNGVGGGGGAENGINQEQKEFVPPYIPKETDAEHLFTQGITSGDKFNDYEKIPIKVTGNDVPPSIVSFETSQLAKLLLDNVSRSGYGAPTPIQKAAIPALLAARDVMGCAQTGSGKTAAFLLPILHNLLEAEKTLRMGRPQVVIVSPTRELSTQIFDEARKFAAGSYLKICNIYGGTSTRYQVGIYNKGCHVLVATPGRLLDFMEKGLVTFEDTKYVVLDEADRILDMGFREDVNRLMGHPTMETNATRCMVMFSATFPSEIQKLAGRFLNNYIFIAVGIVGGACATVEQNVLSVPRYQKRTKLMEMLGDADETEEVRLRNGDGTMIFVETKRQADFLAGYLCENGHRTTSIHGDRTQQQREEALDDFKQRRMNILIATSVAARGLDIRTAKHVIVYDMPKEIDDYVHRIGRTGRVGNLGRATTFFDPDNDGHVAEDLIRILEQAEQQVPTFLTECSGGDGGGGGMRQKDRPRFGGRDIRMGNGGGGGRENAQPKALELEEVW